MTTLAPVAPTLQPMSGQETMPPIPSARNNIPIMRHIIPDSDTEGRPSNFDPVQIQHAVNLMTDPHSRELTKRHIHIIQKIVNQFPEGFFLEDLVDILNIINCCADRAQTESKYIASITSLVRIIRQPFIKLKLSDEEAYKEVLKDTYAQLGFLLRVADESLQLQVCDTLLTIFNGGEVNQSPDIKRKSAVTASGDDSFPRELHRVSKEFNRLMLEESRVADTLVKALAFLEPTSPVLFVLFQLLRCLAGYSAANCAMIVEAGGAYIVCSRLTSAEENIENGLYYSTEILWNLLENGDTGKVVEQLANTDCLRQLHDAFVFQVPKNHSRHHRHVRNDLLAIINLIARTDPLAPFIEVGLAKTILVLATFSEVKSNQKFIMARHLKLSKCEEDFEMKRMLLAVIINLAENPSVLPLIQEYKLIPCMQQYMTPVPSDHPIWLPSQFEEIQLQCLAELPSLFPALLSEFVSQGGLDTITAFLDWCILSKDEFKGHGNSMYASGARGTKLAQTRYVIRLTRSVMKSGDDSIMEKLLETGLVLKYLLAVNTITSQFEQTPVHEFEPKDNCLPPNATVNLEIIIEILYSLAVIGESNVERKDTIGEDGVALLVSLLKLDRKKVCLGLGYTRLILATLDAVWCCVCGSYSNECLFLEKEGAFLLLDLLDRSQERQMRPVVLGALLDLMENPKAHSHITTWTGKSGDKAAKLMINIWKEEAGAGGKDADAAYVPDVNNPLQLPPSDTKGPTQSYEVSYAISQVSVDLRPKIYGFFCKLGFTDLIGLDSTDYVWLTVIEKYLDFTAGEVWKEIAAELEAEQVSPVEEDQQALEAILRVTQDRAFTTLHNQQQLFANHNQQELTDEKQAFAELRDTRKQQEKIIADFENYVKRTSKYSELCRAKMEQDASIENSRVNNGILQDRDYHVTAINNLTSTVFVPQTVTSDHQPPVIPAQPKNTAQSSRSRARFDDAASPL